MDCPVNPPIKSGEGNDTGKVNPKCATAAHARQIPPSPAAAGAAIEEFIRQTSKAPNLPRFA
jgi:hypothetical protein